MDINYFYLLGIVLLLLWIIISARQKSIKQRCYKLKRKIAELLLEEGLDIVHLAQKLGPRPPAYLADILEEMEYNDHLLKTEKVAKRQPCGLRKPESRGYNRLKSRRNQRRRRLLTQNCFKRKDEYSLLFPPEHAGAKSNIALFF